jgi:hypothetical protein
MAVISTLIEPHRVTRVFFDCRDAAPDPADQRRVERAIELSNARRQANDDTQVTWPIQHIPEHRTVENAY